MDPYPAWFYGDFDQVDTHAFASPPISTERPTWPVLVFLPGWGSPREDYSALFADLASRGYMVVELSQPYEWAVSVQDRLSGLAQLVPGSPARAVRCSARWQRRPLDVRGSPCRWWRRRTPASWSVNLDGALPRRSTWTGSSASQTCPLER